MQHLASIAATVKNDNRNDMMSMLFFKINKIIQKKFNNSEAEFNYIW